MKTLSTLILTAVLMTLSTVLFAQTDIYGFKVKNTDGSVTDLSVYKGKVLLVVNTATSCTFTPQYEGLEKLYQQFKANGFEVLDFPCNQFMHQAKGTDKELSEFCKKNYGTQFTTFARIDVNGKNEDPLYSWLKSQEKGKIKWNFTKFLVDRNGKVVKRFASSVKPEEIEADIKAEVEK